ncbi:P-loop containing nucleoside triphosphate hydrolase protein [Acaromyces ingoldii]|uniref:P-loop containing nucleoside triphosphate hydrolase protein n=1 Tax=Acaromyces ingoldii TaxID=215250 RepID=A0A316YVA0_9BASI|nr:P-loop containing nucleoside triphosphate hydrolase protein [Acaromyces ingoldii]PWN92568.1 P-loop containing nucleoside triphosphate hydrolase protein [Acaromyces ingoldii]
MSAYKARLIADHICSSLPPSDGHEEGGKKRRPLFVGMQGPQGSGKTTVTSMVAERLKGKGLSPVVMSLDDLYLSHDELVELARNSPTNKLLHGRGQPGTHDMRLGSDVLRSLSTINGDQTTVLLPVFDKSLHAGQGDRSKATVRVSSPVDVVIFEGWCLGFLPIPPQELEKRYAGDIGARKQYFSAHQLASLSDINERLQAYTEWYGYLDAFVQLVPRDINDVFAWRLQAEHNMISSGKEGMTDQEVHDFVARYMPGYELFSSGVNGKDTPWSGRGMALTIDANRDVLSVERF